MLNKVAFVLGLLLLANVQAVTIKEEDSFPVGDSDANDDSSDDQVCQNTDGLYVKYDEGEYTTNTCGGISVVSGASQNTAEALKNQATNNEGDD